MANPESKLINFDSNFPGGRLFHRGRLLNSEEDVQFDFVRCSHALREKSPNAEKWTRKTPNTDTFHAVMEIKYPMVFLTYRESEDHFNPQMHEIFSQRYCMKWVSLDPQKKMLN